MAQINYLGSSLQSSKSESLLRDTIKCELFSTDGTEGVTLINNLEEFDITYSNMKPDKNWDLIRTLVKTGYKTLINRENSWEQKIIGYYYSNKQDGVYKIESQNRTFVTGDYYKIVMGKESKEFLFYITELYKHNPLTELVKDSVVVVKSSQEDNLVNFQSFLQDIGIDFKFKDGVFEFKSAESFTIESGNYEIERNKTTLRFFSKDFLSLSDGEITSITKNVITLRRDNGEIVSFSPLFNEYTRTIITASIGDIITIGQKIGDVVFWSYPDFYQNYSQAYGELKENTNDVIKSTRTFGSQIIIKDEIKVDGSEYFYINTGFINELLLLLNSQEDINDNEVIKLPEEIDGAKITTVVVTEVNDTEITVFYDKKYVVLKNGIYSEEGELLKSNILMSPKVKVGDVIKKNTVLFNYNMPVESSSYNNLIFISPNNTENSNKIIRSRYAGKVIYSDLKKTIVQKKYTSWKKLNYNQFVSSFTYSIGDTVIFNDGVFKSLKNGNRNNTFLIDDVLILDSEWWVKDVEINKFLDGEKYSAYSKVLFESVNIYDVYITSNYTEENLNEVIINNDDNLVSYLTSGEEISRGATVYYIKKELLKTGIITSISEAFVNKGFVSNYLPLKQIITLKRYELYLLYKISSFEIEDWKNGNNDIICSYLEKYKTIDFFSKHISVIPNLRIKIFRDRVLFKPNEFGYNLIVEKFDYNNIVINKEYFIISLEKESPYYIENVLRTSNLIGVNVYNISPLLEGEYLLGREGTYEISELDILVNAKNNYISSSNYEIIIDNFITFPSYTKLLQDLYRNEQTLILISIDYLTSGDKIYYNNFSMNDYYNCHNTVFSYPNIAFNNGKLLPTYYVFLQKLIVEKDPIGEVSNILYLDSYVPSEYKNFIMNINYDGYRYIISHNYIYDNLYNINKKTFGNLTVAEIVLAISRFKNFVYSYLDFSLGINDLKEQFEKLSNVVKGQTKILLESNLIDIFFKNETCHIDVELKFSLFGADPIRISIIIERRKNGTI